MKRAIFTLLAAGIVSGATAQDSLSRMLPQPLRTATPVLNWANYDTKASLRKTPSKAAKANMFEVTSGAMDPKRLTYVAPDEYFPILAQPLLSMQGEVKIYTHYTKDMMKRFIGNKLSKINTVAFDGATKVTIQILNSDFEIIYSKEAALGDNSLDWGQAISVDVAYEITGNDIYICYDMEFDPSSGQPYILAQGNRIEENSMLVDYCNGSPIFELSSAFGCVPMIWCETEGSAGLNNTDIMIDHINGSRVNSGDQYNVSGSFVNMGVDPVRYIAVKYQKVDGSESEVTLDAGEALPYMNKIQFNMAAIADAGVGVFERLVTVSKVNDKDDDYPEDNSAYSTLFSIGESMERNIAVEEYTGSWCGYCTRGISAMRTLDDMYGERVVHMEIHSKDYMAVIPGEAYDKYGADIPGWPHAWVNRTHMSDPWFGTDKYANKYFGMGDEVGDLMKEPTEAAITLNVTLSDDKSVVYTDADVTFSFDVDNLSKYYRVGYVLLENGLTDVQSNFYSERYANHPCTKEQLPLEMQGFFDLPELYMETYNHVAREEFGALGIENSLTGAIKAGGTATHHIEIPTDAILKDKDNAAIAAFILDSATGEIINIAYKEVKTNGIINTASDDNLTPAEYYNLQGRRLDANRLPDGELLIVRKNGRSYKTVFRNK